MRRFLESLLVIYALFLTLYLLLRFLVKAEWGWLLTLHLIAPYLFIPIILGLLLALLMASRRIAGIYLLLLLGGLLWFAPILLPKLRSSESSAEAQRLISFNLFMANPRLDAVLEWLIAQDADLIALQEVPHELPELEAVYPHFEYTFGSKSLALFSRYPISLSSEFELQGFSQQRFILEIEGQNIAFYNIHLVMPLGGSDGDLLLFRYDESLRNQQIEELLAALESETLPFILAGDFNMSEWSPIYSRLAAVMEDSWRNAAWGLGTTWPDEEPEEAIPDFLPPLFRLDYVWHSPSIESRSAMVGGSLGSDHLPLLVEFQIEGGD